MNEQKYTYEEIKQFIRDEIKEPSEVEIKLANDLLKFAEDYDPYGFADSSEGYENDLASEIKQLRNPYMRKGTVDYLQEIIKDAVDNSDYKSKQDEVIARQLIEDISKYSGEDIVIYADKLNNVEEKTMENQNKQQTQETTAKYFNKHSYGEIENKAFLSCNAKTAYEISQKAQEQGVTFSAKYDGDKSSIVVDGVKDKAFVDAMKAEFKVHTADDPTFFNSRAYKDIHNKTFISCDAKTAYAIGQKAQEQGVTFSAKYDGDKSSIVVDGAKDIAFVDAMKREFKVHTSDDPTFYNSRAYKDIENKTFLNTDAKTAYAIGQKAQEQGVIYSAKFDGDKSAVTVDGVKDKAFVDAMKAEFNLIDKLNEVEAVADKIEEAFESGEVDLNKDEHSVGQER